MECACPLVAHHVRTLDFFGSKKHDFKGLFLGVASVPPPLLIPRE